jgi:hypothetical protein
MNREELRELLGLVQINDECGLTDEEYNRFIYLKEKMEQDDFDDFLCATIGLF